MSTDVLGRIVEVVSDMPLHRYVADRIARPLKLPDTGFSVEDSKKDRGALPQKGSGDGQGARDPRRHR